MVYLVYYLIFSGVGTITDKKRTYNLQIYGASEMKMSTTDQRSHTDWELYVNELFKSQLMFSALLGSMD